MTKTQADHVAMVRPFVEECARGYFEPDGQDPNADDLTRRTAVEFASEIVADLHARMAATPPMLALDGLVEAVTAYRDEIAEGLNSTATRRRVFRALALVEKAAEGE